MNYEEILKYMIHFARHNEVMHPDAKITYEDGEYVCWIHYFNMYFRAYTGDDKYYIFNEFIGAIENHHRFSWSDFVRQSEGEPKGIPYDYEESYNLIDDFIIKIIENDPISMDMVRDILKI